MNSDVFYEFGRTDLVFSNLYYLDKRDIECDVAILKE